jgi:hypothetical protein
MRRKTGAVIKLFWIYAETLTAWAGASDTRRRCDVILIAVRPLALLSMNPVTCSSIGYKSPNLAGQSTNSSTCAPTGSGLRHRKAMPWILKSTVRPVPVYGATPFCEIRYRRGNRRSKRGLERRSMIVLFMGAPGPFPRAFQRRTASMDGPFS